MERKRSARRPRRYERPFAKKCKDLCRQFIAFLFSNVGIIGLVISYTMAGAFIFRHIERNHQSQLRQQVIRIRNETVSKFWNKTLELNTFHEDDYKNILLDELYIYQKKMVKFIQKGYDGASEQSSDKWSFAGAFLYSLTVITTIDINNIVNEMLEKTPPVFAAWFGTDLVIFDSKPGHVEVLLNSCMEKSLMYSFISEAFRDGLLTSPGLEKVNSIVSQFKKFILVTIWRRHRKLINPTFNLSVLSSFIDTFAKHSNILVHNLENCHATFDVLPKLLRCTLDIMCETLADVDASSISGQDDFVRVLTRAEELVGFRLFRVWLYPIFFWKFSNAGKEFSLLVSKTFDFTKQVLEVKQMEQALPDGIKKRKFLNHILDLNQNYIFNEQEVLEELYTHLAAGTDTTAVAASSVLITLGMYKDVQAKVYQELYSIFESSTRDPTLQDLNQMVYLENVIKETMRLLPPVPFVGRFVDQDVEIEKQVFPKGCNLVIPIGHMNRMEEFWEDPLTFNPNRFLKESTKSQHRCTFIPFSFGARNCIGFKHATLSLKVVLSTILRSFKVDCLDYKSTEDVKLSFGVTAKAINGYRIQLERRQNQ